MFVLLEMFKNLKRTQFSISSLNPLLGKILLRSWEPPTTAPPPPNGGRRDSCSARLVNRISSAATKVDFFISKFRISRSEQNRISRCRRRGLQPSISLTMAKVDKTLLASLSLLPWVERFHHVWFFCCRISRCFDGH